MDNMMLLFLWMSFIVQGSKGNCPLESVPRQTDVDVTRNTGIWYEIRWYPEAHITSGADNYGHNYYIKGQEMYYYNFMSQSGNNECFQGPEKHMRRIAPAWYRVTNESDMLWVETDYDNYFVEFVCSSILNGNCTGPSVLLFSRKQTLDYKYINRTKELVKSLCVPQNRYIDVVHNKDCATNTALKRGEVSGIQYIGLLGVMANILHWTFPGKQ